MISGQTSDTPSVADEVRDFYERHPYPPPVETLDDYGRRWRDPQKRRAEYHLLWPAQAYREDRSILIAGCGTSQAAKHALRWPGARVTGIDVSATSIECTETLRRQYQLQNLETHRLPIEEVSGLGRCFDHIVCTGVLHHLSDPDAGFRALRQVLAPGGVMQVMVYAPYGRAGVYMLQDYCRRLGVGNTSQEIRDLAATLATLPRDHPLVPLLRSAPDFHEEAGLADALLHPCDRAYSVPQFLDCLRRNGLAFGRWLRQAPYRPTCGAISGTPHAARLAQLPINEAFAAMELFRGNMVRHSAIVQRGDEPDESKPLDFDGTDWRDYVPLRLSNTIALQDRLPAGSAAVLINRSHTDTDLFLPINEIEKRLFDAIDGRRSISMIAGNIAAPERARTFLERLWRYDQVIFQATGGT